MSGKKHYEERDAMELDRRGNYYIKHVAAMTKDNLRSKSDIAAELGYRDMVIDQLKADKAELVNLLREARESGVWHRNLTKLIQKHEDTNNDDT